MSLHTGLPQDTPVSNMPVSEEEAQRRPLPTPPPSNGLYIPPIQLNKSLLPLFLSRRWLPVSFVSELTGIPVFLLHRIVVKQLPRTHRVLPETDGYFVLASRKAYMPIIILACIRANWSLLEISRVFQIPLRVLKAHIIRASDNCVKRLMGKKRTKYAKTQPHTLNRYRYIDPV